MFDMDGVIMYWPPPLPPGGAGIILGVEPPGPGVPPGAGPAPFVVNLLRNASRE